MPTGSIQTVSLADNVNAAFDKINENFGLVGPDGGAFVNVTAFGAVGDNINDDTTGLQASITSTYGNLNTTGNLINIPRGEYKISATLQIYNSAQTYEVDNITLQGAGRQSSVINAEDSTSGPGIELVHSIFNNITDLTVLNAFTTGINIDAVSNTSPGQRTNFERVQVKGNHAIDRGSDGFAFERSYLCRVSQCNAEENKRNGFYHNFQIHTSWLLENNYGRLNGTPDPAAPTFYTCAGFKSDFNVYSAYIANAADENRYGYHILGNRGVTFISNGAEFNARSGFFFEGASNYEINWVSGIGNTCGGNNTQGNGFANHTHVTSYDDRENFVVQRQPVSFAAGTDGTYDFIASGQGAKLVIEDPLMTNLGARSFDSGYIQTNYTAPKLVYACAFEPTQAAKILTGLNIGQGTFNDFSGELLVIAHNAEFAETGVNGTATHKLLIGRSVAGLQVVEIASLGLTAGNNSNFPSFTYSMTTPANSYTATSGQTVFPYTFTTYTDSINEIKVTINSVLQPSSAYTVDGIGVAGGGNVTLNTPATVSDAVVISHGSAQLEATPVSATASAPPSDSITATSGQTVLPYTFLANSASDIKVTQNGTLLALTTDYTVDGLGTAGGNVTLVSGATTGDAIVITGSSYFWFSLEKVAGNFIFA